MGCRDMAGWLSGEKRCKRDRKCPSTLSGTLREDLEEMGPCNGVAESSETRREQRRTGFHLPGQWASSINHSQIITTYIKE